MCWRYSILLTLFYGMIDTRQYLLKARPGKGNNNCVLTCSKFNSAWIPTYTDPYAKHYLIQTKKQGKITVEMPGAGADPGDYSDSYAVDGNFHYQDHVRALCSVGQPSAKIF